LVNLLAIRRFAAALAALATLTSSAWAAERVTLRNGFEIRCDHHGAVEGRTRLYLSAGGENYIEFQPEEIAGVEMLPEPPQERRSASRAQGQARAAGSRAGADSALAAQLSPADLGEMLAQAGHEHNLDEDLLASLVKAESGGNARAVSRAGARGLMQLMPATASQLGVEDSFQPDENLRGGSAYLDGLLTRYHDNLALALAAYNAGPAAVDEHHGIPPYRETQAYVARVIHEFNRRVLAREAAGRRVTRAALSPQMAIR
jgi:soluble lytic murein transglycosylase-like protein